MSGNLGFYTYLISDATASFCLKDQHGKYYDADMIHDISLATLQDDFAKVLTAEQLIKEMAE